MNEKVIEAVVMLPDGDLYYFEAGDGQAYVYGGCEHYDAGVTGTDLKALVTEYQRTKKVLETIRAMEVYMQDEDVGSPEFMRDFYCQKFRDAINYAKSGLLGGGE